MVCLAKAVVGSKWHQEGCPGAGRRRMMLRTRKDVQDQEECLEPGRTEWILTARKDARYWEGCSRPGRAGGTLCTQKEAPLCSHSPGACVTPRLILEQPACLGSLFPGRGRAQAPAICAFNFPSMRLHCLAAAQLWKGIGEHPLGAQKEQFGDQHQQHHSPEQGLLRSVAGHGTSLVNSSTRDTCCSLPPPIPSEIRWDNPYFYTSKALQYFAINERSNLGGESL